MMSSFFLPCSILEQAWAEISEANAINTRLNDRSPTYRRLERTRPNVPSPSQSNFALKSRKTEPQWVRWQGRLTDQVYITGLLVFLTVIVLNSSCGHSSGGSEGGIHVSFKYCEEVLPDLHYNWVRQSRIHSIPESLSV